MTKTELNQIQQNIGYSFNNPKLLIHALTHKSAVSKHLDANERMEFLGDSLLSIIIANYLYRHAKKYTEGALTRSRAYFVCGTYLCKLAKKLAIEPFIRHDSSKHKTDGIESIKPSILEGTIEALIAAIYLDSDIHTTTRCVLDWYGDGLANYNNCAAQKDPKTALQEYCQCKKLDLPLYTLLNITGKAHAQQFSMRCTIKIKKQTHTSDGVGRNKQQAELDAAKQMLTILAEVDDV